MTVSWGWVKGHYTGDNREVQHDLNALADTLATNFREDPPEGYRPLAKPMFSPLLEAALYQDGSMITATLPKIIYAWSFQGKLTHTFKKRSKWSQDQFQAIDWDIFGKVFGY